jgi:hypothetical protein
MDPMSHTSKYGNFIFVNEKIKFVGDMGKFECGSDDLVLEKWYFMETLVQMGITKLTGAGSVTCSYCAAFASSNCCECPIYEATRMTSCQGTPWIEFKAALSLYKHMFISDSDGMLKSIQDEIRFLENLLRRKNHD